MAWQGYLINGFPNKYIKAESYSVNPNQREEIRAYRDDWSRNLIRITANGMKTKIVFETVDRLSLSDMTTIQTFFTSRETSAKERKCQITYWDPETQTYDSGYFYRPNVEYVIDSISDTDVVYKGMKISLTEY